jgi:DNA-binding response OmpR family regulator
MRYQFVKSRPVLVARAESGAGGPGLAGPARDETPAAGTVGDSHAFDPKPTVPRVLVVDDEPSIRLLCRVNLTAAGMEVVEAVDGNDALELARTEAPDIVLLDVMMPGIDGWKVAGELAADELTRDLPIVFLTARAERADRERGHDLGGVGYLLKPFDPVMLAALVETTLERIDRGEREELRREMFGAP